MSKEILRPNEVLAPTLFVGVGGIGSKIVKHVSGLCRPEEVENVNFVCLDTNVNDLSGIGKASGRIYRIQTSTTQTVGNYLDFDLDALKNWFPKNAILYAKSVSEGAGQVRAISRMALNATIKTGKIHPLFEAIDDLFRKDGSEMKQALRVCIVSTASGGTGSGLLLPLSMYIRDYVEKKYPNTAAIVRMLIVLPEVLDSVIDSNVEKDSQRRNAYATIKELNAFMLQGSGFFDVDPDLERYKGLKVDVPIPGTEKLQSLSTLPCDFCFLMDGQDAEDSTMVDLKQYIAQAGQALYEQNIGPMQKDAFSVEDNIIKELSKHHGRNRFGGIGASVVRYPFEDVVKYVAYDRAIDCLGGEGDAAKWIRYDKEIKRRRLEAEKNDLAMEEAPKDGDVYIEKLDSDVDKFSRDLRAKYGLVSSVARIADWFREVEKEVIEGRLYKYSDVASCLDSANGLDAEVDYTQESNRKQAPEFLQSLRGLQDAMETNAKRVGASFADSVFYNEGKTAGIDKPYMLEFLLRNKRKEIMHPNAMRYILYKIQKELDKKQEQADIDMHQALEAMEPYGDAANDKDQFDIAKTKNKTESSLDDVCRLVASKAPNLPDLFQRTRIASVEEACKKLNEWLPDYYEQCIKYGKAKALYEVYTKGIEYISNVCKQFEAFYATFTDKVAALVRRQDDLVESLQFRDGDTVLNVCASGPILKELSREVNASSDGMLDSDLNGEIFDAVKKNVIFLREIRNSDVVEEDRRIDIFDDIIQGHFVDTVRKSELLDVNVIRAIAMENRLNKRIKAREDLLNSGGKEDDDHKVLDNVTLDESLVYIEKTLATGRRLAAPSIQRLTNEESREIALSAYNEQLNEMRDFRMSSILPKGAPVDTVSRYEVHFFNALYNLTADRLNKFASKKATETGVKNAGMYHNAYVTYSRNIGPDSTKTAHISTHIDKRWDSLAAMPELDAKYQKVRVMQIHQGLIYGLIHGAIMRKPLSAVVPDKRIYKYENSDERYVDLIVSNGTPCDQFYEILDALYISSNIVEDIETVRRKKMEKDKDRNASFENTRFAKDLNSLRIDILHSEVASIFEIIMAYYNTLPTNLRYTGELAALTEAVLETLWGEIQVWENAQDAPFIFLQEVQKQFALLIKHFEAFEKVNAGYRIDEENKIRDNKVIDVIYRKICRYLTETVKLECEETLGEMKDLIS